MIGTNINFGKLSEADAVRIQNDLERDVGVLNTEKKSLHDKVTQLSGLANEADIASYKSRIEEIHEEVKKRKKQSTVL